MARKPKNIVLSEQEEALLSKALESGLHSERIKKRIEAVLLRAKNISNKEIACKLDVRESSVGDWISSFIKEGINGLYDAEHPGRRGSNGQNPLLLLKENIEISRKENKDVTVKDLSKAINTSENNTRKLLRDLGLKIGNRKSNLEIPSVFPARQRTLDFIGLFLSGEDKAFVVKAGAPSPESMHGILYTREASVASKLNELKMDLDGNISIEEILKELTEKKIVSAQKPLSMKLFMEKMLRLIESASETCEYYIVLYSNTYVNSKSTGLYSNLKILTSDSSERWLTLFYHYIDLSCDIKTAYIVKDAVNNYVSDENKLEAVMWQKKSIDKLEINDLQHCENLSQSNSGLPRLKLSLTTSANNPIVKEIEVDLSQELACLEDNDMLSKENYLMYLDKIDSTISEAAKTAVRIAYKKYLEQEIQKKTAK